MNKMKSLRSIAVWLLCIAIELIVSVGCGTSGDKTINTSVDQEFLHEVDSFLEGYNMTFQRLKIPATEAQWKLNTHIEEGDTMTSKIAQKAQEAMVAFTGSEENINAARRYLKRQEELSDVQVRQLEAVLYAAGSSPAIVEDMVKEKIKAQNEQTKLLFGFDFNIDGESVSTNDIDDVLVKSRDLDERLKAWEASKAVGAGLRSGLLHLRELRNGTVQALDYKDYFQYQVSEYGMTSDEMVQTCRQLIREVWPLYRELHTWARYELADRYGQHVPELIPAHWLPNRWGQEWSAMVESEGVDLDEALGEKSAEWIVKQGEDFYVSLGYPRLPQSFYDLSSLYPLSEGTHYKKNNHASAWHIDNDKDVRSLMSIKPDTKWWGTTLHELGHIYYYMTYSNDSVPIILRGGANRAYHEAMGTLIGLASMQPPFLKQFGLMPEDANVDPVQQLLTEALDYVVLLPWGAGVMTEFEHDLYAENLDSNRLNARWWELKANLQGIAPPNDRGEEYCDAASKTHINNDAAQYYDYALSNVLLFQFHDHIARNILKQDPHSTNYYGSRETGAFLQTLMKDGANCEWRDHLKKHLGTEMSAKAMVDYFEPLMKWLKEQNAGRVHSLPQEPHF